MYITITPTNDSAVFFVGGAPFTSYSGSYYGGGTKSYSGNLDTSGWGAPLIETNGVRLYFHNVSGTSPQILNNAYGGVSEGLVLTFDYETA